MILLAIDIESLSKASAATSEISAATEALEKAVPGLKAVRLGTAEKSNHDVPLETWTNDKFLSAKAAKKIYVHGRGRAKIVDAIDIEFATGGSGSIDAWWQLPIVVAGLLGQPNQIKQAVEQGLTLEGLHGVKVVTVDEGSASGTALAFAEEGSILKAKTPLRFSLAWSSTPPKLSLDPPLDKNKRETQLFVKTLRANEQLGADELGPGQTHVLSVDPEGVATISRRRFSIT